MEKLLSSEFVNKAFEQFSFALNRLNINISELDNIKITALALIISALIIFLLLIVVVIFCNIINLFRKTSSRQSNKSSSYESDSVFSEEEQQELELELQKELDLALAQRAELEQKKEQEQQNLLLQNQEKEENARKKKQEEENDYQRLNSFKNKIDSEISFDWKKQQTPNEAANTIDNIDASNLSYKQEVSKLYSLIGLLINMFGRGVDDLKIAQTLNYKTQGLSDENDILKLISAVKYFISLCQSDKFYKLENYQELPDVEQALYHLINNDVSLALVLLENLMDKSIDKSNNASENKRQQIFSQVSDYACCLGTLAENSDLMLATSVYEMAIELNSSNATAWSRLGDVYRQANSESKAIWAYQNAYSFADSEINASELANASQNMSNYLYAQGNTLQATKMHNIAKQYYDSLNINNSFTEQEIDALKIIESNQQQNIPELIANLLQNQHY